LSVSRDEPIAGQLRRQGEKKKKKMMIMMMMMMMTIGDGGNGGEGEVSPPWSCDTKKGKGGQRRVGTRSGT